MAKQPDSVCSHMFDLLAVHASLDLNLSDLASMFRQCPNFLHAHILRACSGFFVCAGRYVYGDTVHISIVDFCYVCIYRIYFNIYIYICISYYHLFLFVGVSFSLVL